MDQCQIARKSTTSEMEKQQRYCILGGGVLNRHTQAGLCCRDCKQKGDERRSRQGAIEVRYCFFCGRSYAPADASIHHRSCALETMQPPSSALPLENGRTNG